MMKKELDLQTNTHLWVLSRNDYQTLRFDNYQSFYGVLQKRRFSENIKPMLPYILSFINPVMNDRHCLDDFLSDNFILSQAANDVRDLLVHYPDDFEKKELLLLHCHKIQSMSPTCWVTLNSPLVLIASLIALHDRTVLWSARKHHWSECLRMMSKDSSLAELKSIRLEYDAWFFNSATIDLLLEELISPHSGSLLSSIIYEMAEESIAAIDGVGDRDCSFFGDSLPKLFYHADVGLSELSSSELAQINGPL